MVMISFKLKRNVISTQRKGIRSIIYSMDPLGILFLLGAVCSLFLLLQQGGSAWPWRSSRVIVLLISSVILLTLFGFVEWHLGEDATVPLHILKDRTVLTGSLFLASGNTSSYAVSDCARTRKKDYMRPKWLTLVNHRSSTSSHSISKLCMTLQLSSRRFNSSPSLFLR